MKTINDIIRDLVELTEQNRLHWSVLSPSNPLKYGTRIPPDFLVEVWSWRDPTTDAEGVTATLEKDGVLVDRTSADRFAADYPSLSRLYETARRRANNVDASINQVLQQLAGMKR